MNHNTGISQVDEPIWLVESKASHEVPWCVIPKGCISRTSTEEVEEGCNNY